MRAISRVAATTTAIFPPFSTDRNRKLINTEKKTTRTERWVYPIRGTVAEPAEDDWFLFLSSNSHLSNFVEFYKTNLLVFLLLNRLSNQGILDVDSPPNEAQKALLKWVWNVVL